MIRLDSRQPNAGVTGQVFLPQTVSHLPRVYSVYISVTAQVFLPQTLATSAQVSIATAQGIWQSCRYRPLPQGLDVCRDAAGVNRLELEWRTNIHKCLFQWPDVTVWGNYFG